MLERLSLLLFSSLLFAASPFTPALLRRNGRLTDQPVVYRRFLSFLSLSQDSNTENGTVVKLKDSSTGQLVTLIGTAHVSKESNEEVKSIIQSERPDVVMIELDEARLERIGFKDGNGIGIPYVTADDISVPLLEDDRIAAENRPLWAPVKDFFLDILTKVLRKVLTGFYDDLSDEMGDDTIGGGEFLTAINAAKNDTNCERIVLGDQDSMLTIRRVLDLAIRSGNPFGVLNRLTSINEEEMSAMEQKIRKELEGEDESTIMKACVEEMKADTKLRNRLFSRLEREVPEFTRAFVTERDFIMAESIRREICLKKAKHVVAVVGLAHVPGMAANLQNGGNLKSC